MTGTSWTVVTVPTESLGNRSYVVVAGDGAGRRAIAVDPPRDIDRVEAVLSAHGAVLDLVVETHRHADYASGGLELARRHGVRYAVPPGDPQPEFEFLPVVEGDVLPGAGVELVAVATPGHTPHHTSYVLVVGGEDRAVFTGGSMLYGTVGRTDLVSPELTEPLAHDQWHSVRRLGSDLEGSVEVLPTHGFGSFCSSAPGTGADSSTVARERVDNPALTQDEDPFVASLLAGYDTFPAYYAHMPALNAHGPADVDLAPPPVPSADEVRDRLARGEWVVDVRPREEYAAEHLRGTLSFSVGSALPVYLAWLAPWGQPVTLLAPDAGALEQAQRELARVGWDRPVAAYVGPVADLARAGAGELTSFEQRGFADLAARLREHPDLTVVDVRRPGEWREGHLRGAVHVPLHELLDRTAEVPPGAWVHCHSGMRATVAASILERAGVPVVAVDDDYEAAEPAGLTVTTPEEVPA